MVLNLHPDEFNQLDKGRSGYNAQLKWNRGNVFVLYNTDGKHHIRSDNMGIHVIMTGSGCDSFMAISSIWRTMAMIVALGNYKFSRIDLAIDDKHERLLSFSKINWYVKHGLCSSRWSKWNQVTSQKFTNNKYLGRTMYFGSTSSDIYCRIYDKSLEQQLKHQSDDVKVPEHWTRMELVFKKERANLLVMKLLAKHEISCIIRGVLQHYVRFLQNKADLNRNRWVTAPWWKTFIGEVAELTLTVPKKKRTIDQMTSWVDRQISPTLAAIMSANRGDLGWLKEMITNGRNRLKRKHLDAISEYTNRTEGVINE